MAILQYWKQLLATAVLIVCAVAVLDYGRREYARGFQAASVQYEQRIVAANEKARAEADKKERAAAEKLAAAQTKLEKEKENAKQTISNMRDELERVQQYVANRSRYLRQSPTTAGTFDGETASHGWQLFGSCAKEYANLAEIADAQNADLKEWQAYGEAVVEMNSR